MNYARFTSTNKNYNSHKEEKTAHLSFLQAPVPGFDDIWRVSRSIESNNVGPIDVPVKIISRANGWIVMVVTLLLVSLAHDSNNNERNNLCDSWLQSPWLWDIVIRTRLVSKLCAPHFANSEALASAFSLPTQHTLLATVSLTSVQVSNDVISCNLRSIPLTLYQRSDSPVTLRTMAWDNYILSDAYSSGQKVELHWNIFAGTSFCLLVICWRNLCIIGWCEAYLFRCSLPCMSWVFAIVVSPYLFFNVRIYSWTWPSNHRRIDHLLQPRTHSSLIWRYHPLKSTNLPVLRRDQRR
jgi:hypothetical protein